MAIPEPISSLRPKHYIAPPNTKPWPPDSWSSDPVVTLKVEPLQNGEHLQLGITRYGMERFLKRIDFPFHYEARTDDGFCLTGHDGSYVRDEDKLGYVTKQFGPLNYQDGSVNDKTLEEWIEKYGVLVWPSPGTKEHPLPFPSLVVGYDFAAAIRLWLKAVGKQDLSVCEVLLAEGNPHVGRSNVFNSHIQSDFIGVTLRTMKYGRKDFSTQLPAGGKSSGINWWLDYFLLRQCRNDFDVNRIRSVITRIGCTMVDLDEKQTYTSRSFCIFEAFSTVESGATLLVQVKDSSTAIERLTSNPLRSSVATTRDVSDKEMIDDFITRNLDGGFVKLDSVVSSAILQGIEARGDVRDDSSCGWSDPDDEASLG